MTKAFITFAVFALSFDAIDRTEIRTNPACAIWSDAPGDEVCESRERVALEDIELRDGRVVRELACQGVAP